MAKNLLVAGGAGFIGCNFVRFTLKKHKDWNITVVDDLSFSRLENLKDVLKEVEFSKVDVSKYDALQPFLKNKDLVVNFVAQTHVDRSIADSRPFIISEVLGTDNLLRAARENNVGRYLQVSTDEVYGEISSGSFKPGDRLNPRNPYAAAKAGADLLVRASWYTFQFPVLITRCSNNFGPYQHPEKFIPKTIAMASEGKPVPLYGDGEQIRDWIHVSDHCSAIDLVLERGEPGGVYHAASGNEMKNVDVASFILAELGRDSTLIQHVTDRLGHDRRYSLDTAGTRALGWSPSIGFEEGLRDTIRWYVENQVWWKPLIAKS